MHCFFKNLFEETVSFYDSDEVSYTSMKTKNYFNDKHYHETCAHSCFGFFKVQWLIQRGIIRLHPTFEFKKTPKNQNVMKQGKKKIIIIKIKIKTEERKRKREERLNTLYIC